MKPYTHLLALVACLMACNAPTSEKKPNDMDTFKTKNGKTLQVTPIKHASMELNFDGRIIQVDPVTEGAEPFTDYSQWAKADFILITHDHYDHFDAKAVATLCKESTVIVTNANTAEQIDKCEVMSNGDTLRLADDLTLYAVPAYNITPGHTQFHPKGRDNGFILEADGLRIYIAGDTEDIEEMSQVNDIDVAFLPCNQPYTMTPEQLRHAANMVKPRVLFPYHYGDTAPEAMESAMEGSGIEVRIRDFQ